MPYCEHCKKSCFTYVEDAGIGSYEYWGAIYHDHHYALLSRCCDAEVFQDPTLQTPYTYTEYLEDYYADKADHDYERAKERRLFPDD